MQSVLKYMGSYYDLPESVQYKIFKIIYSDSVIKCLNHKDWWWHTVQCRANKGMHKLKIPLFLDAEIYGGGQFFAYGN